MTDPLLYVLAVLTILGTPGPTNTLLATSGAMVGLRRSLPLLLAELGGYLVAIAVIRLVLGPVFSAYPLLAVALKLVVAVYLAWIAVGLWVRGAQLTERGKPVTLRSVFVTTLLNPKALIFAISVIPAVSSQLPWYLTGFAVMVLSAGFSWILVGAMIGTTAGERHARLVPRIGSVALAGFAGVLGASAYG